MKSTTYKSTYDKMKTSVDMDDRIMKKVMGYGEQKKKVSYVRWAYGIVAVMALVLIVQIQPVQAAVNKLLTHFTNQFEVFTKDGEKTSVNMQGDYIEISSNAPNEECKMNSVAQVSEKIGIKLLESKEAYEKKNCISYTPYISENGKLNGIMLSNSCYAIGDLRNVELTTYADRWSNSNIVFSNGEKYNSPIAVQITIRSDSKAGVDYYEKELEYAGRVWKIKEDENSNVVEISNLGIKAVLYTSKTDGPEVWSVEGNTPIESVTSAIFVYEGIEYIYYGAVSQETMVEFLNTLY